MTLPCQSGSSFPPSNHHLSIVDYKKIDLSTKAIQIKGVFLCIARFFMNILYCESGLKAPRGVEPRCPLCCSPEKETWSDYSQTLLLSYLWLSHRRGRGRDRQERKNLELMMWLKHEPALLKCPKWLAWRKQKTPLEQSLRAKDF